MRKFQVPRRSFSTLICFFVSLVLCSSETKSQATIFRDDFNGQTLSDLWQQPTSWSVDNQAAYIYVDGGDRWLRTDSSYTATSYTIETAAKGFTSNYKRTFRISFGQPDATSEKMYILNYQPDVGGLLTLGLSTDNFYYPEVLDRAVLFPVVTADKTYKFRITKYQSGLIQVYVDRGSGYGNVPFLEAIDSTHQQLGHVGWREDTETYAEPFYVDWIGAVKPVVEKPAVKEKPEEDDLITQVTASSPRVYKVAKLKAGIKPYTDRNYIITSFPSYLNNASFVRTAMDDKKNNTQEFLTSVLLERAIVYIGYDPRGKKIPDWLKSWTKTGDRIELTDPGTPYVEIYSKLVDYWEIFPRPLILGGNLASPAAGAEMNYFFAAVPVPGSKRLEAEDAMIVGAQKANNHQGYSGKGFVDYINASGDYIEWTVNVDVPGTYNLGFTFANGSKTNRPLEISLNRSPLNTLLFQPISSFWSSWAFTSGPNVFLTSGTHKIRATVTGSSGPNMDYLSLSYLSASPTTNYVSAIAAQLKDGTPSLPTETAQIPSVRVAPNPFGSTTTLYYSVKQTSKVKVAVFASSGQLVQVLEDKVREPGEYNVGFNGSSLPKGLYFYRVQQGDAIAVGKLLKQ